MGQPLGRVVTGFKYLNEQSERGYTVCRIVARAELDAWDEIPLFSVAFKDGFVTTATADQLNPWYRVPA